MDKIVSSANLAAVRKSELETSETSLEDLGRLLADPARTEPLMLVTRYYRDFFDDFWYACYQLAAYDEITYLIDFDVLREYLEVDSVQKFGSFVLDSLFSESTKRYCIPAGAFRELLDYIQKLARKTGSISSLNVSNPESVVRQLALFFEIKNARDGDLDEVERETRLRIEGTSMQMSRLCDILTNPRFAGVVSSYETQDVERLESILSRMKRSGDADEVRSKKDKRDAINLAIAIKSVRAQRRGQKVSGHVLLSNTRIVQKLPRMLLDIENDRDRAELLGQLAGILGVDEAEPIAETPKGPDFSFHFPALHPALAINAELQGIFDDPTLTMFKVWKLQNEYHKVNNFLRSRATIMRSASQADAMRPVFEAEFSQEVAQSLKSIAEEMLSVKAKGFVRMELRRETAVSVAYSRQEQKGGGFSNYDRLTQKSTDLLSLFGRVLAAVEGAPGFQYVVETETANEARPFELFRVIQEPAPDGQEPLAGGEVYPAPQTSGARAGFFAIRWPVVCRLDRFLRVMKRVIVPIAKKAQDPARTMQKDFSLTPAGEDPALRLEGLIVFVNDRAFGCPLEVLLQLNNWDHLRLNRISWRLQTLLNKGAGGRAPRDTQLLRIQQYRINTMFGDFVFDIEPAEGDARRYFTLISHYNLAKHIAMLYKNTGVLYTFPDKLAEAISPTFAGFEDLPDASPEGVS